MGEESLKRIIVLSSLRSGSTFLTDNLILSLNEQYKQLPARHHYGLDTDPPKLEDGIIDSNTSVVKLSWMRHLEKLEKIENLNNFDAILLKRKDKFAQLVSTVTAMIDTSIEFNYYKDNQDKLKQLLSTERKIYIPKEIVCLQFWIREFFEKGIESYRGKFKSFIDVDYEDIDGNIENLKNIYNHLGIPDHNNYTHERLPIKREWDKWGSVENKEEVLSWVEPLFSEYGYVINSEYYKK